MKIAVKIGILFALLWIIVKLAFFYTSEIGYDIRPLVLINMLLLTLAISIGLYLEKRKRKEASNMLLDIKDGLSAGLPYTIVVSVFLYFYYSSIDPEYNRHQIDEAYTAIYNKVEDPVQLEEIRKENPEFEVLSKEEILTKAKDNLKQNFNAQFTMTVSMLALLLFSTINSIFIAIIYRRLLFR